MISGEKQVNMLKFAYYWKRNLEAIPYRGPGQSFFRKFYKGMKVLAGFKCT